MLLVLLYLLYLLRCDCIQTNNSPSLYVKTQLCHHVEQLINRIINNRCVPRSSVKDPCGICYKIVKTNQRAIQCDCCESWVHITCNDISPTVYEHLKYKSDLWHCLVCSIITNLDSMPFTVCNNLELTNINNSDSMRFLESLPNVDIVEQIVSFTEHASNDSNIELPAKGTCKYYSVKKYQLLNKKSNFNIFHSNIIGLESKLDNLHEFLTVS